MVIPCGVAGKINLAQWFSSNQENYMQRILTVSVGLSLLLMLAACSDDKEAMQNCIDRGVAFHKSTGARTVVRTHPDTGRLIEEVVQERCERSTAAF